MCMAGISSDGWTERRCDVWGNTHVLVLLFEGGVACVHLYHDAFQCLTLNVNFSWIFYLSFGVTMSAFSNMAFLRGAIKCHERISDGMLVESQLHISAP